ncbi:MAG: CRISPR-associated helicase Cas3' [candidate division WOR-3 bacterium]
MDEMKFYSHPNKKLIEHLNEVGSWMKKIYKEQKEFIKLDLNEKFFEIVGKSHDFGKYTTFFQNYLKNGQRSNLTKHSLISALFCAYWLIREKLENLSLIGYLAIRHHHGDLSNFNYEDTVLKEQIEDLKKNKDVISGELNFDITEFLKLDFSDKNNIVLRQLRKLNYEYENNENIENYFKLTYTFSLLIDCDKKSAINLDFRRRRHINSNIIDEYRKKHFKENNIRNELYEEILKNFENLKEIPKIISVNAPTGLGKTLINLSLALKIREKLNRKYKPRIIYSLPFLSIIEQTYEVFENVLKSEISDYEKYKSEYLLKHHHLSEIEYKTDEEKSVEESLMLISSWNSEIIITTFVQLLYSIIAYKNSFIKKFHNIAGSIIILDEVQNIDVKYWDLIKNVLNVLVEKMGCYVIISTATKPVIFDNCFEILTNKSKYILNRTRIVNKLEINSLENLRDFLLENLEKHNSHLIVLNTIRSSVELYKELRKEIKNFKIFYLSTNIVPKHRKERIEKIKNDLKNNEKIILVSTQVVEAGVDLDFEVAYRDLGPFDSIVQVCGRCNRNFKRELSDVYIFKIIRENRILSSIIYGSVLTEISEKLLKDMKFIEEREFYNMIDEFYKDVIKRKNLDSEVLKGLKCFDFKKIKEFKIIKEIPNFIDVFVEVDEEAKNVYEEFLEILKIKDFRERYKKFLGLRQSFYNYLLSIPKDFVSFDLEPFPRISFENLNNFYDLDYGFKRFDREEFFVW